MFSSSFPYLPLWLMTVLFFIGMLLAREAGYYLRRRRDRATTAEGATGNATKGGDEDSFAMTSVLGLLALLIGFTFSVALGRYDERRQLVVQEANALGTTWLRTDLLAPEDRDRVREVMQRYVDARVDFANAYSAEDEVKQYAVSTKLQNELWAAVVQGVVKLGDTPRAASLVTTTNESIDLASDRYAARQDHIPPRILRMLLLFALLAAGLVGYQRPLQRKATVLLLLAFSLAVGLVLDLDRPTTGLTSVPQEPMLDLQRSFHERVPPP